MRKALLPIILLAAAFTAQGEVPATALPDAPKTAAQTAVVSRGHNLRSRNVSADARAIKPAAAPRGIRPDALRRATRSTDQDASTALLLESFEGCQLLSDRLPDGWTRTTNVTSDIATRHWYGVTRDYCQKAYYPLPPDGDAMMLMFYDDFFKDETLVTPSFSVPSEGYELSYYWFTIPVWLYVIDRDHIDMDKQEFIEREKAFDFEVLLQVGDGEWQKIYSLEEQFAHMEYSELSNVQYAGLQRNVISLDEYAGKEIRLGFRYWGTDGNVLFLDAVRVDLPAPDAHYTPHYSRLFFGLSDDDVMQWLPASVEFVPVDYPVTWYNTSDYESGVKYSWTYENLGEDGTMANFSDSDQDMLQVTYRPDYSNAGTLRNNLYYVPSISARGSNGAVNTYSGPVSVLQAGGTTEFDFGTDELGHVKYTAFSFDIINEGLGRHVEEDEELGFFQEPIFGYSPNHDAWWEHYSYPSGNPDKKYSYVDGFANLILPHDEAPMVVNGVSAMAYGTIYPEATFYCRIYRLTDEGVVVETPALETSIRGSDVIAIYSGMTRDYLTLNFPFDEPFIMSAEDTGLGYMVEISGYHDPKIEYFAPLQSMVPNEYEWCLGFYHHYWPLDSDLTNDFSYVAFFTTDFGEDLYSAFAIGLDAHYPWLHAADASPVLISGESGEAEATILGYYDADAYTADAPDWLDVSFDGRYNTTVRFAVNSYLPAEREAHVVVSAPGVSCTLHVKAEKSAGIHGIAGDDDAAADVFNLQGMRVRRAGDTTALPAGIYISNGAKMVVK